MTDYKLVPVDAIRRAASILGSQGFEAWDQLASELESMIASAPAVQGEPVGEAGSLPGTKGFTAAVFESKKVPEGTKLYTAPQPGIAKTPAGGHKS